MENELIFKKLLKKFPADEIEWRISQSGLKKDGSVWARCLAYITNRAIQDRLDEVFTPFGWRNEFKEWKGGQLCGISVKVGDDWITKWDGAQDTQFEAVKGGLSDSMKRAAVQWGIGRYLYNLDEAYATISADGKYYQSASKDKPAFKWNPPALPAWALPTKDEYNEASKPEEKIKGDLGKAVETIMKAKTEQEVYSIGDNIHKRIWTADELFCLVAKMDERMQEIREF